MSGRLAESMGLALVFGERVIQERDTNQHSVICTIHTIWMQEEPPLLAPIGIYMAVDKAPLIDEEFVLGVFSPTRPLELRAKFGVRGADAAGIWEQSFNGILDLWEVGRHLIQVSVGDRVLLERAFDVRRRNGQ